MTAGRLFKEHCPRCEQQVDWETTGFLYGPWAMPLKHNKPDGSLCAEKPVLIKHEFVEVKPYDVPITKLLDLEYTYSASDRARVLGVPQTENDDE
jgi:hypothetical protein